MDKPFEISTLYTKFPNKSFNDLVYKEIRTIHRACENLCCANSPFGGVKDQPKVWLAFTHFCEELNEI